MVDGGTWIGGDELVMGGVWWRGGEWFGPNILLVAGLAETSRARARRAALCLALDHRACAPGHARASTRARASVASASSAAARWAVR